MRLAFTEDLLGELTYIDGDSRYRREGRPIGIKAIIKRFCRHMRQELPENYGDSWHCNEELTYLLKTCDWYYFYDFIELVAEELKAYEQSLRSESNRFDPEPEIKLFGFDTYRSEVNSLFEEEYIAWRLNEAGVLTRVFPQEVAQGVETAEKVLVGRFALAKQHYEKARRYLFERPLDPENSIKEMVTALESIALVLTSSKNATLGDAVKALKKKQAAPERLLDVIERIYIFACAEPGVRHGKPVPSRVTLREADLVFHTGAALMRYLVEHVNDQGEKEAGQERVGLGSQPGNDDVRYGSSTDDEIPF
jgi:hypothetical protein